MQGREELTDAVFKVLHELRNAAEDAVCSLEELADQHRSEPLMGGDVSVYELLHLAHNLDDWYDTHEVAVKVIVNNLLA